MSNKSKQYLSNKIVLWLFVVLAISFNCVQLETQVQTKSHPQKTLKEVKSWLYQLQYINLRKVADSDFDLIVTDYAKDGDASTEYRSGQIKNFKAITGKIVLAYLSIGEAEDYRFYWKSSWKKDPPSWLDKENENWEGNYKVHYWDPAWQKIIFSYIDRIIDEGFDGVYLDIIDAYDYYQKSRPQAEEEMIDFVSNIAHYCRVVKGRKNYFIFPQNAPELVTNTRYMQVISGIGQEETYFRATDIPSEDTEYNQKYLDMVQRAGKLVLSVDYCNKPENIKLAYEKAGQHGYVEYCTVVDLDKMILNKGE